MKILRILTLSSLLAFLFACSGQPPQRENLFNGVDLHGWTRFIPGDSVDVNMVWMVKNGVVHCTGVPTGYMRTNQAYGNYKLHVEWRWTENPGNSGVLLHIQNEDKVWPSCMESQLKAENAGDLVIMGPGHISVDGVDYTNDQRFLVIKKKQDGVEKPAGEWNSYDITCKGGSIRAEVNGVLQNEGSNSYVTSGYIGLQSEGAPIEFRNIYIEEL